MKRKLTSIITAILTLCMLSSTMFACGGKCENHEYYAGACKHCTYNIFNDLSELSFNQVDSQTIESILENVKTNSTQGELSFAKYGAQINHIEYDITNLSEYLREDIVKIKFVDNIYKAEILVNSYKNDFTHNAYIVDKLIYSFQPNMLNNLEKITDCSNEEYNTILDNVRKATSTTSGNGVNSWDVAPANFIMAYEELYKLLSTTYYTFQLGNYIIVKAMLDDEYMGNCVGVYVYDESYDLVAFDGRNVISNYSNTSVSIRPLLSDVTIPADIVEQLNNYTPLS